MAFQPLSIELSKILSKDERKELGIFFTPKNVRDLIFSKLDEIGIDPKNILEPSCGSGEFLQDLERYENIENVVGIEFNKKIYDSVKSVYDKYTIINQDFLQYKSERKFDLIIGNPPYFVTEIKNKDCMSGKGNIFVLFIYKCITEHLSKRGVLAFVLPTSFYNSKYYEPCRRYIYENNTILHVENVKAKYIDTNQDTMILILMNKKSLSNNYFVSTVSNLIISPYYKELKSLMSESTTIASLGGSVKTGEVVWNQHKEKLNDREGMLIIYSSNIVDNKLELNNLGGEKKQFIVNYHKQPCKGPCIVISRGYGNNFKFNYVLIDEHTEFFGENHVNIITHKDKSVLEKIFKSIQDNRTEKFIKYYTGNGALSKTELETIFPIFV